jgi:hypothetical protein
MSYPYDASPSIEIGRLLRAATTGFVAGCRLSQADAPEFGALARAPLGPHAAVYGLVYDIHVDDDGLVRQLAAAEDVDPTIIADNRQNRNVPAELSILAVGHRVGERILHLLPPRPPLTLDAIHLCAPDEIVAFSGAGRFGYFRHILRLSDQPVSELLAAHLRQAQAAHTACGDPGWAARAAQELITLLRDDYPTLMSVLGALRDTEIEF